MLSYASYIQHLTALAERALTRYDLRQDRTHVVIDRMPQPAWVPFVADKRSHLIPLGFASSLNVHGNLLRVQGVQQSGVHRRKHCFFLLECN
jgi:hypothetical protein